MISSSSAHHSDDSYDYKNPADILAISGGDSLLPDLVNTAAIQRLKQIRFLGGIDYSLVPWPNGLPAATRYTRYQHSVGVLYLAHLYCTYRNVRFPDRKLVCAAALLHDVGHPPLSHSLESTFKRYLDIDHHDATRAIISGSIPLGRDVQKTLLRNGLSPDRVIAVVAGQDPEFQQFFGGPINFDTIEGVLRCLSYTGRRLSISPKTVVLAAIRRATDSDKATVDQFWEYKNHVYGLVINSRDGVLSDAACRFFMQRHIKSINADGDYFATDAAILRKLPGLRSLLISRAFDKFLRQLDAPISYQVRRYYVDTSGDFFAYQDNQRYRHERHVQPLSVRTVARREVDGEQRELFRNDS